MTSKSAGPGRRPTTRDDASCRTNPRTRKTAAISRRSGRSIRLGFQTGLAAGARPWCQMVPIDRLRRCDWCHDRCLPGDREDDSRTRRRGSCLARRATPALHRVAQLSPRALKRPSLDLAVAFNHCPALPSSISSVAVISLPAGASYVAPSGTLVRMFVNGVPVYPVSGPLGSIEWAIPSLGVEIGGTGSDADRALHTLRHP